ncbi:Cof-type HAD-IIB family hydrolase [Terrilactibacillus sp. BCM23-1]|uniref:Cof-type HAD-IIB family hydrolase n=1 Tax=Terrilactibacillus tamarindi TaxID=2599694 RepID=A0A6N8CS39_9BACI|nr:Cof-type HAD-IIB family hydrolase [Terrilactibacillus tamarindi]MTT30796.1 Cof-type HAD-IIB family hydrolase [Terrilactibacillus tamarindi]
MKLIAIDLDGTLLTRERKISENNIKALKEAQKQDIQITIATGRASFDVNTKLREIGMEANIIGTNGASVHTQDGQLLYSAKLNKSTIMKDIKWLLDQHFYMGIYTQDIIFVPTDGLDWLQEELDHLKKHEERAEGFQEATRREYYRTLDSMDVLQDPRIDITKVLVFSYDDEKLAKGRHHFSHQVDINMVTSGTGNFEIMANGVSKGHGLKLLANHLNIKLEDTVAIGDNYNDLSMFEVAGVSVAMGNAYPEIKETCQMVTKRCEEDGVAYAINELLRENAKK